MGSPNPQPTPSWDLECSARSARVKEGRLRIALVTATPPSVREGSGTYVAGRALARGLAALGHELRAVAPATRPAWLPFTAHRFAFNVALRPSRVHGADLVVGLDLDGYRLAGRTPVPFVAYILGQLADEARFERGVTRSSMLLQARAERASARRADRVVTTSRYSRSRIAALYGVPAERIAVVPPAFDVHGWHRGVEAAARTAAPRPGPTVLCAARLYPRKNLGALFRAAARIVRDVPALDVRVVGDGPARAAFVRAARRAGVADRVRWLGHVSRRSLAEEYARCDVFCLPSLQEGFGIACLEALAAGRPVVALRASATPEIVEHGVTGLLVPPDDDAALARALLDLLRDPERRAAMGAAGPARAARYAPPRIAAQFLDAVLATADLPTAT